jgi:hypothetical protein
LGIGGEKRFNIENELRLNANEIFGGWVGKLPSKIDFIKANFAGPLPTCMACTKID